MEIFDIIAILAEGKTMLLHPDVALAVVAADANVISKVGPGGFMEVNYGLTPAPVPPKLYASAVLSAYIDNHCTYDGEVDMVEAHEFWPDSDQRKDLLQYITPKMLAEVEVNVFGQPMPEAPSDVT